MKSKQRLLIKEIADFNSENIGKNFEFNTIEYIDTGSVQDGKLIQVQKLDLKDSPSRAKRIVRKNDILISTVRPNLKHYFFVKDVKENTVVSTGFVVIRPKSVNPRYLYYFLTTPVYTEYLTAVAESHTSAYPSFPQEIIENTEIELPLEEEQDFIAKTLGSFDDLIENLTKQNKILEQITQTIFKSWFVYFDRQTEFVDSEVGEIPKGWVIDDLNNIVDFIQQRVRPDYSKDNENYISLDAMPSGSINLTNYTSGKEVNSSIIQFKKYDILFGNMRPYFKKVGIAPFDGITRTTTFVLRSKESQFLFFALFHLASDPVIDYATSVSIGSTIPYVRWESLKKYKLVLPQKTLLDEFNKITKPIIDLMINNSRRIEHLRETRDLLLPKLISGEIRV